MIDSVRALHAGTGGDWMSLALVSRGQYGVPDGLVFSYPVMSDGTIHAVVEGVRHGPQALAAIRATSEELMAERDGVKDLIPS